MKHNKYTVFFLIFPTVFVLLFLCSSLVPVHKFYFSLSEIRANTKKRTIEISCKLFTDDVEDALFKLNHRKIDLAMSGENKTARELVDSYLHERLHIVINGTPCKLELIGFETENDICWFYLESHLNTIPAAPVKMKIRNALLFDFLPDQTNVMQVIWNEQERTERVVNPEREVEVAF